MAQVLNNATAKKTDYDYDAQGQLTHVTLPGGVDLDYTTDAAGRRIAKKRNGNLEQGFLYSGSALAPAAELDSNGDLVSRFVYATRANVPDYMVKGGVAYRIVTDDLGSPRVVVNSQTGTVLQRIDYDEFGNVTRDTNPGFQPFGYAGGLYDQDTKLVRFGARDYDPLTGRWTAKDPIGFQGGDTSLYGYVVGDPVNLVDVGGLDPAGSTGPMRGDGSIEASVGVDEEGPEDFVARKAHTVYDDVGKTVLEMSNTFHIEPNFGKCSCGGESFGQRSLNNFVNTNTFVPGLGAPTGAGFLTSSRWLRS